MEANNENKKMPLLISSTLRIGVITACTIALVSGIYYLISHGMDPMPDYQSFHGETTSLTTLSGIFTGMLHMQAENWIQFGVIVLMLTPISRIVLSLFDFGIQRDWLYVGITAIVLFVIVANSIGGF